jgi:preprotein translocase subunit YajC
MSSDVLVMVGFLVLLFAMFYFFIIRPQRMRQKQHESLLSSLNRGDKVITIGGIYGEIDTITEDSIVIKIESGATMRLVRAGIAMKQPPPGEAPKVQ